MCSAWTRSSPRGREQRGGAVGPLLDVRAVGGPAQHRTHLLGDAGQAGDQDLQRAAAGVHGAPRLGPRAARLRPRSEHQRAQGAGLGAPALRYPHGAVGLGDDRRAPQLVALDGRELVRAQRGGPRRPRPQRDDFDRLALAGESVAPRVLPMEVLDARDPQLVALPGVPAVERDLNRRVIPDERGGLGREVGEREVDARVVGRLGPRPHDVALHGRAQQTDRRQHARARRDDHRAHAERARDRARVQWTGTAERDENELARVDTLCDGDRAHCLLHRRVDHREDVRRRDAGAVERGARRVDVEAPETGELRAGRDAPGRQVGIGHGRGRAAAPVARGSGNRARALRSDDERAAGVDAGDGAAARADRVDVERGEPDRVAGHDARRRRLGHPAAHEADVGAGATHVEGDRVGEPARGRDLGGGAHSPGRPGQQQRGRQVGRDRRGDEPARRGHDQHLGRERFEGPDVVTAERPQRGVGDGRHRPLVFAELRRDLVRAGHVEAASSQHTGDGSLVVRVEVGVQEADRDRVDAVGDDRHVGRHHRFELGAVGVESAADLEAQGARHERRAAGPATGRRATGGPGGRSR